ncbi:MAG: WecB/TagA/CpsF family glycosyltransferase [Ignavibacteriae bacterium]|nr:WecB/TagA/CpsF family glycosyltransferase [Ignavibacteriota bacterium]
MSNKTSTIECFYFKSVKVSISNLSSAVDITLDYININNCLYICVTDVNNLVNSYRRFKKLKLSINNSLLSLPDGRPLSIFGRLLSFKEIDRVAGPDYFNNMLERSNTEKITHCFIGDTEETLNRLVKKIKAEYPNVTIKGIYSPPFRNWSIDDNNEIVSNINKFNADVIWISFGGGKQEIWMNENCNNINRGIMVGIGAGFKWYLGDIKRAPLILQKLSLEWCYRLYQDPIRIKNYITSIPLFIKDSAILLILHYLKIKRIKAKGEIKE